MNDLELIAEAAREAGEIGLKYFRKNPQVWTKGKDSPVSEADIAIDRFLKERLLSARPDYGWLSEETNDNDARLSRERIFVVDPIDGTRGFIAGSENWLVSIAVVEAGRPVVGALYGPVLERLYLAAEGKGATCNEQPIAPSLHDQLNEGEYAIPARIAHSIQENLATKMRRARHIHSLAYRIALVADGGLSGLVVRPLAQDWDIAAADLILQEAGGSLTSLDGDRPGYNRRQTGHDWLLAGGQKIKIPLKNALIGAIELFNSAQSCGDE